MKRASIIMNAAMSAEIAIITTVGCPYCKKSKEALQQAGLSYKEIELSSDLEALSKVKEATQKSTVPQVDRNMPCHSRCTWTSDWACLATRNSCILSFLSNRYSLEGLLLEVLRS